MTKSKSAKKQTPLEQVQTMVNQMEEAIPHMDDPVKYQPFTMPVKGTEIYKELEFRCAVKDFTNLLSAMDKKLVKKANSHLQRLKNKVRSTANDYPFKKGDLVEVTRYEHGWEPGYTAKIKEVHTRNRVHSYTATVLENHNGKVDELFDIEIEHTRDAHLSYGY